MAAKKNTNTSRGGALSTTPSNKAPANPTAGIRRLSPGIYRNPQGQLVNSSGQRIDSRGRPLKIEAPKTTPTDKPGGKRVGTPNAPKGSAEEKFRKMTESKQSQELGADYGAYLNEAFAREQARLRQGQPDFSGQLESARQTVMGQFERTMGPEFQRQQMELRQRMAEQGIDPNSGAYQAQMKMLNDSQNAARQNAMTEAFTQGAGYQQQGFTQDVTGRLLPFQIAQLGQRPYELQFAARTEAEQKALDRAYQERMARSSGGAAITAARIQADAMRDAAAAQAIGQYNQPQQPSAASGFAQGLGTGAGAAATNWALR